MKIVMYWSGPEVLACTLENEKALVQKYFVQGGRVFEEYDRFVSEDNEVLHINAYASKAD